MVSGPLTDGCYGRGQSLTAANRHDGTVQAPMQIVCPNCTTSYQIADAAIGANGRSVRCVRCQTVWLAVPPAIAGDRDRR